MACTGCAAVRAAGVDALQALANGDTQAFNAALNTMTAVQNTTFAASPVKAATTRAVAAGLSRLGARRR